MRSNGKDRKKYGFYILTALVAWFVAPPFAPASPKVETSSQKDAGVFADGERLNVETASDEALQRLKARPRVDVIAAVKPHLASGRAGARLDVALDIIGALDLRELKPDVISLAKTTDSWRVLVTANRWLGKDNAENEKEIERVYLTRLSRELERNPREHAVIKIALLDGLSLTKSMISTSDYAKLLEDQSFDVRRAAVANFLMVREKYQPDEQLERFRRSFKAKPYQVRLAAMNAFADLSVDIRKALRKAVDDEFNKLCKNERNSLVKEACGRLLKEMP